MVQPNSMRCDIVQLSNIAAEMVWLKDSAPRTVYFCPLPCPLYLLRAPMPIPCAFLPCATGNSALVIGLCLLAAEDTGLSSFHLGVLVVGN